MINLLPPDVKQGYSYARRNTQLFRWVLALGASVFGLVAISLGGMFYLNQQAQQYNSQVEVLEENLKQQDQARTTKEVTEISGNLKLAVQVLSKQVLYSRMLSQLATIIPSNVALANLNLSQVQGALDLTANTADYTAATQLQVNLADPANKLFTKADIVNINCTTVESTGDTRSKYPCTVTIRALFSSNNPYLFSNNTAKGAAK